MTEAAKTDPFLTGCLTAAQSLNLGLEPLGIAGNAAQVVLGPPESRRPAFRCSTKPSR
jgi:hypothetical protein